MSLSYKRHRFPSEIISYCVWRYYTFPLSYRDIEKMMLCRGIIVTYEAIRFRYAWNSIEQSIRKKPHKVMQNPIWRDPTPPEGETWMVGISYIERNRLTEPYVIALCRQFLESTLHTSLLRKK